jgi:hypothetical protein
MQNGERLLHVIVLEIKIEIQNGRKKACNEVQIQRALT